MNEEFNENMQTINEEEQPQVQQQPAPYTDVNDEQQAPVQQQAPYTDVNDGQQAPVQQQAPYTGVNYGQQYPVQPQVPPQPYPYAGNGYGQPIPQQVMPVKKEKKDSITFGLTSMILGILSVFLFATCINYLFIILSVIFGIIQLVRCRQKGMAIAGLATSGVSLVLSIILWIFVFRVALDAGYDDFNDYYDYYNDYYDDFNPYSSFGGMEEL